MYAELAGLAAVAVGAVLIATAPTGLPAGGVYWPPARPGSGGDTPLPFVLAEFPPESARLRAGRWTVIGGLAAILAGLVLRWV